MAKLAPGDLAPDIELPDQNGTMQSIRAFRGRPLVLYFYPADNTPICTAQACGFRDELDAFHALGAAVMGISSDSVQSHSLFAAKHKLSFPLLADTHSAARKAFGVPSTLGFMPGRATYVLDSAGIIRRIFVSALSARKHVAEAKAALSALSPASEVGTHSPATPH